MKHNLLIFFYVVNTLGDWDSMDRVITQTSDRVFQTHGRAFSFPLSPQKFGPVF